MIYTSNFSKITSFPYPEKARGRELIGIVRIPPQKSLPRVQYETVIAPRMKILKQIKSKLITEEQYRDEYIKQLEVIGVENILKLYDEKVLLCYCGSKDFCHRHILREWLATKKIKSKEI